MKIVQYYIMRHAAYCSYSDEFVSYWGMLALKSSMEELRNDLMSKFPNKDLQIIYSSLPRARQTALLMREMLRGITIVLNVDVRLNSDQYLITKEYVDEVVSSCERQDKVCLILSHEPDINCFCQKKLNLSEYLCMNAEINKKDY